MLLVAPVDHKDQFVFDKSDYKHIILYPDFLNMK